MTESYSIGLGKIHANEKVKLEKGKYSLRCLRIQKLGKNQQKYSLRIN